MPTARSQLVDLNVTSYYHCFNRCVRQEFLLGKDEQGKDYSHRKQWMLEHLKNLTDAFGIQLCAYAIMSNHYHTVLHVDKELVLLWSDTEIIERWQKVAKTRESPTSERIAVWRERLYDISWFMRFLNERMARVCNKEEGKKGRFWDNRFKSQALIDDGTLLACMAYVDLNVVRAGQAQTLETSDFTSIQERLKAYQAEQSSPANLMSFQTPAAISSETASNQEQRVLSKKLKVNLPFTLPEYIALVDWTGRQVREGKGAIAENVPTIVKTSGLNPKEWMNNITYYNSPHKNIMGTFASLCAWATKTNQSWLKGQKAARQYYLSTA